MLVKFNLSTDDEQITTRCPLKAISNDEKRNKIYPALIVTSMTAGVFCLAYLILLASEKYLVGAPRVERVLEEVITA